MHVDAILCDSAKVREGLLHLLGGGITRLWRDSFPSPMTVDLALVLTLTTAERQHSHTLNIEIRGSDGEQIANINGKFEMTGQPGPTVEVWEEVQLPLVVPLQGIQLPTQGEYRIEVLIDNQSVRSLGFRAGPRPPAPAPT